ncbi:class I SAM-dependent methyltransferase [Jiangella ureilytica]|uniref:Class I SAM-dependent methyltransferase n=1 Tax=Jiangella ureilytica TaxID=2530374 RepID=A0A4R4RLJ7_9ACTN|nr:class I SAM-dependent methyltransferase [Jiangella ureilytica]TDC50571.1 class I SAM-dependent methyltransferase [Jiangella ureilytica]
MSAPDDSAAIPVDQLKRGQRALWAAGDYASVAEKIAAVGRRIVDRVGVGPGDEVLDVACGTGNAAIPAAVAGARVTGVDLTPELFAAGRDAAAAAGVTVDWREGDAEDLPIADGTQDVVLSTFGAMFAPRHEVTARELARVLRPGGRLGLCNWRPDGTIGGFFATVMGHVPPPPPYASPPPMWGDPDHVRRLFDGAGLELEFEDDVVELPFGSVAEILEFYSTRFGPIVAARGLLKPQGRWPALHDDLRAYFERATTARDGGIVWALEYLVVLGRKT